MIPCRLNAIVNDSESTLLSSKRSRSHSRSCAQQSDGSDYRLSAPTTPNAHSLAPTHATHRGLRPTRAPPAKSVIARALVRHHRVFVRPVPLRVTSHSLWVFSSSTRVCVCVCLSVCLFVRVCALLFPRACVTACVYIIFC